MIRHRAVGCHQVAEPALWVPARVNAWPWSTGCQLAGSAVTWGAADLSDIAITEVRRAIVVALTMRRCFAVSSVTWLPGPANVGVDEVSAALHAAVADEMVLGLRLQASTRSSNHKGPTYSGGQRQRVAPGLPVRSLPSLKSCCSSSLHRGGRTHQSEHHSQPAGGEGRATLVVTTSPLWLDKTDSVYFLIGGKVCAVGSHATSLPATISAAAGPPGWLGW